MRGLQALVVAAMHVIGLLKATHAQGHELAAPLAPTHLITHGVFVDEPVFRPVGKVQQFVLLFTGGARPSARDEALVQSMVAKGSMVVLVPMPAFYRGIAAVSHQCVHGPGAVENFARYVQAREKLPGYIEPLLVGTGNAGAFVYGLLAQAPADIFTAALSLDFCPRLTLPLPLCTEGSLRWRPASDGVDLDSGGAPLSAAWTAMQADAPPGCAAQALAFATRVPGAIWIGASSAVHTDTRGLPTGFDSAFEHLAAQRAAVDAPPARLADLPVTEVPATGAGSRFAVMISGDGGWASIDKRVATALAEAGVPVAGIDSLRYFWSARTPESVAADLDRVIRYYAAHWKRSDVILVGYSQGADVLPFALNRLPARTRAHVRLTALLGPGEKASFEFHVSNWIGKSGDRPIGPEARKMLPGATLCIYGSDEREDSLCPLLEGAGGQVIAIPGGHHLGGDYEALAGRILAAVPQDVR
jgi:type IV secretory pathway VirJ component